LGQKQPEPAEISAREERAHHILDAAETLILRWGYNKTNVEDIAKEAGVGKGTIYLHWKTREDLFRTLIKREQLKLAADFRDCISSDPAGATLRGVYKCYALAYAKRPLLKAFLLQDSESLGKYAQGEHSRAEFIARMGGFQHHLMFLREQGLLRTDRSVQEQVYVMSSIFMGFYFIVPLMPDEYALSDEHMADLMAETMQRALESDRVPSPEEIQTLTQYFLALIDATIQDFEADFRRSLNA
jgi:AcrR family transcriptional regulator